MRTIEQIIADTKAAKVAGALPTYPEHTGTVPQFRAPPVPVRRALPCVHEGNILERCHTCNSEGKHVRECDLYEKCTRDIVSAKVRACKGCKDYRPEGGNSLTGHLNGSIIKFEGRTLLASRFGISGARIGLTSLDAQFQPITDPIILNLNHFRATAGQEDPRLFIFEHKLHVGFCGVEVDGRSTLIRTHQLVTELDTGLKVRSLWEPQYEARQFPMEKNWVYFESAHVGGLHSVYSIEPHVVLRHDGTRATKVAETRAGLRWNHGLLRGGASPVLVGNEWYHWFHGTIANNGKPIYTLGLYTFDARPPFTVRRFSSVPLAHAPVEPNRQGKRVIFPCGAILRGDKWFVSCGVADEETRVLEFSATDVESKLVRV